MRTSRPFALLLALCLCCGASRAQSQDSSVASGLGLNGLLSNLIGQAGQAASQLGNSIAPIVTSMADLKQQMYEQYSILSQELDQVLNVYEQDFCTPAKFMPGSKKPAQFVGHGFSLSFSTGSCYFNSTAYHTEGVKVLNCTEPQIEYVNTPANFTSKYHAAPDYTSKYCQISKTFGEPVEKVLHVFDGVSPAEIQALTDKITAEVQNLLGSLNKGASSSINNLISTLGGLPPPANSSTVVAPPANTTKA